MPEFRGDGGEAEGEDGKEDAEEEDGRVAAVETKTSDSEVESRARRKR